MSTLISDDRTPAGLPWQVAHRYQRHLEALGLVEPLRTVRDLEQHNRAAERTTADEILAHAIRVLEGPNPVAAFLPVELLAELVSVYGYRPPHRLPQPYDEDEPSMRPLIDRIDQVNRAAPER